MDAPLLQACGLLHTLLDARPADGGITLSLEAREALGRLGARLTSVAAGSGSQGAREEEKGATAMAVDAAGGAAGQVDRDITTILPTPVLVHIVGFLLPRKFHTPGYLYHDWKDRLLSSWDFVDALGRTSRRWLAITRDNSIWRPIVHELYGWTTVPMARRPWMRQLLMAGPAGAEEGNGEWARLFRRLARTTFCLEPGGFRQRWDEDFWITIDIRDTEKGITLFSDCGELMVQEAQDAFGGPAGIAWDRLVLGHRALQVHGHPSPEILPRVTGEVPPVEVLERYLKGASRREDLRLTVRLLHRPTGRTTTLYASRAAVPRLLLDAHASPFPVEIDRVASEGDDLHRLQIDWKPVRLPSGCSFPWVSCQMDAAFTAVDGAGVTKRAANGSSDPEVQAWLAQNHFGIMWWCAYLELGEEGWNEAPQDVKEVDVRRLAYRTLQALPWTD